MIVTSGTPFRSQNYSILPLSWDKCLDHCLKTDNCMVVYTNSSGSICKFFKIGTLKIANRSNDKGTKIGFKIRDRFSSTVCPVDDTVGGKGYSFDNYSDPTTINYYNGYTFTYNKESTSWSFNSTGRLWCPIFMQRLFMRPAGLWCIGTSCAGDCADQAVNTTKCASFYGTVMSGIDSMEEFDFIRTMKSMRIGGTRKKSCIGNTTCKGIDAFEFVDPTVSKNSTGFRWHPGKPANEDCLAFTKRDDGTVGIEDVSCTKNTVPGVSGCLARYVCGNYPVSHL